MDKFSFSICFFLQFSICILQKIGFKFLFNTDYPVLYFDQFPALYFLIYRKAMAFFSRKFTFNLRPPCFCLFLLSYLSDLRVDYIYSETPTTESVSSPASTMQGQVVLCCKNKVCCIKHNLPFADANKTRRLCGLLWQME